MSHFTVLAILPKEGLEKYENSNEHTGKDEWQNAYNHQWFHPELEEALAPYNEQPEEDSEYIEKSVELNEEATAIYNAYVNKNWDSLAEAVNVVKERREGWERKANIHDKNAEGGFRKYTESEIANILKPFDEFYELMATEKFDINIESHSERFRDLFCYTEKIDIDNNKIYDIFYSNPIAKWDWWVVGGRWRDMGENGLFEDLSVFQQTKEIPYWKEELGHKLYDIEKELGIDRDYEGYDELITDYIKNNKIVRFYDRETQEPKEYYKPEDLLTMVTRQVESTWAMLFPEEGWIEAGEMGWFGMSSLDMLDLKETEQAKKDEFALTNNLIEKYKDTHIGIVVDCHI